MIDHATWSEDSRQIVYEGLVSGKEWNVYTQKIDGSAPVFVTGKGRNAFPTLSPDGVLVAAHDARGGISLYRPGNREPQAVKGALATERPLRFVDGGHSLLITDINHAGTSISVIDLSSGRRQIWKQTAMRSVVGSKAIVTTPDLKYYAYGVPNYSSDLYMVEGFR
jgi:Tol biopolymer transport system component